MKSVKDLDRAALEIRINLLRLCNKEVIHIAQIESLVQFFFDKVVKVVQYGQFYKLRYVAS